MQTYKFTDQYNDTMDAYLVHGYYHDDSLAVEMVANGDGEWEPWATLTVNLGLGNAYRQFIDTNNCPWATEFLESNGLAKPMGIEMPSGYCTYPMYEFTSKFFDECAGEEYGD